MRAIIAHPRMPTSSSGRWCRRRIAGGPADTVAGRLRSMGRPVRDWAPRWTARRSGWRGQSGGVAWEALTTAPAGSKASRPQNPTTEHALAFVPIEPSGPQPWSMAEDETEQALHHPYNSHDTTTPTMAPHRAQHHGGSAARASPFSRQRAHQKLPIPCAHRDAAHPRHKRGEDGAAPVAVELESAAHRMTLASASHALGLRREPTPKLALMSFFIAHLTFSLQLR